MKQDIKKLWVDALRSGEYPQGKNALKDDYGNFCCLGVLCDLHQKFAEGSRLGWTDELPADDKVGGFYYGGMHDVPPRSVVKWAGLEDNNPSLPNGYIDKVYGDPKATEAKYDYVLSLAEANDEGFTFLHIADMIEEIL